MNVNESSVTLTQTNLRGPIVLSRPEKQPGGPQEEVVANLAGAFQSLLDFHEPLDLEKGEEPMTYTTTVTVTHDLDRDVIGVREDYSPELRTVDFSKVPDAFQMMSFVLTAWLEQVGALSEDDVPEDFVLAQAPAGESIH